MSRLSRDAYFMEIATVVAKRSTCNRRKVGAVIVRDNQILATGYNGSPAGTTHCEDREGGCIRERLKVPSGERHELCYGAHAEANAISQAAKNGTNINGATVYCTTMPCSMCAKSIINAGIHKVIFNYGYNDGMTEILFREAGVEVEMYFEDKK